MATKTILVVDDDPKIRTLLRRCLEGDGFLVKEAADGAGVRDIFDAAPPDLVTLDLNLGAEDGLNIVREIRKTLDVPIIMVTGKDDVIDRVTTADFKLLGAFVRNAKRPLSRDRLMDLIGGPAWAPLDRTIDNQVARLRKKIERDPAHPRLIRTVRGFGYMLTEAAVGESYRSSKTA